MRWMDSKAVLVAVNLAGAILTGIEISWPSGNVSLAKDGSALWFLFCAVGQARGWWLAHAVGLLLWGFRLLPTALGAVMMGGLFLASALGSADAGGVTAAQALLLLSQLALASLGFVLCLRQIPSIPDSPTMPQNPAVDAAR